MDRNYRETASGFYGNSNIIYGVKKLQHMVAENVTTNRRDFMEGYT